MRSNNIVKGSTMVFNKDCINRAQLFGRKVSSRWQKGQGMTEYIVVVALVAVAAIATMQLFGATARNQVAAIAKEVSGTDGSAAMAQAGTAAEKAATVAKDGNKNSLSTFSDQATSGKQ